MCPDLATAWRLSPGPDDTTIVVINHEFRIGNDEASALLKGKRNCWQNFDMEKFYDVGKGALCLGSVTTLVYDTKKKKKISQHLSIVGTLANCGVAPTPWDTAIFCEESFETYEKNMAMPSKSRLAQNPRLSNQTSNGDGTFQKGRRRHCSRYEHHLSDGRPSRRSAISIYR